MVSTFSPNIQLEEPARGDQVGVWDSPVNNNMNLLDSVSGGVASISGSAGSVTLAAAQYQSKTIAINSTLIASITLTFPTSFKKSWEVYNGCTGSSAFTITLQTTATGQVICIPPGETISVWSDGTNFRYTSLGHRVGEFWDYAGSSVPNWVSGCTIPPYLLCNGGTFSAATYPALATILGSTTTPDQRGRTRYMLDQGVGRVSSAVSGVAGNTIFAGGGDQQLAAHTHANTLNDPGHGHNITSNLSGTGGSKSVIEGAGGGSGTIGGGGSFGPPATWSIASNVASISINNISAGSGGAQNMPPLLVSGITLIRAA